MLLPTTYGHDVPSSHGRTATTPSISPERCYYEASHRLLLWCPPTREGHTPPAKRQKIWWDSDEEEERGFDPDTYHDKARNDNTTPEVAAFAKKVFRKCLSQDKRKELSKLFPHPSIEATQVPKVDQLIVDFMAKDFPK